MPDGMYGTASSKG